MVTVGLRELRQQASDLVKRAESGEQVVVTVAGRESVRLVPVRDRTFRRGSEVLEALDVGSDPTWIEDLSVLDHSLQDPWLDR